MVNKVFYRYPLFIVNYLYKKNRIPTSKRRHLNKKVINQRILLYSKSE